MPLNKLDNFIKNTEGRILYVSPSDLDSTDSIDNTGNSLARPFKTIQRALIESARFSYVKGTSNDLTERTTILLMPGDHLVDNRPGFKLFKGDAVNPQNDGNVAHVIAPGVDTKINAPTAASVLDLSLESSFDLTREDNLLYKFNSTEGGVIVPRGTSIVGLDLRKTKIRPLYVPNPTDSIEGSPDTAIFRITGACYFWQFSFFDGDENGLVYTDPSDFSINNKSKPIFSHHRLTCFEYADGVNNVAIGADDTELTDLDMYYAKLSNAYGTASGSPDRNIDDKYPAKPDGFAKQRPEWEIVGAFAADPLVINSITAGSGGVPSNVVTVTTRSIHNLTEGTPIKIKGVIPVDYNISTKVATVDPDNPRVFTYQLPTFRANLETDTAVNSSAGEVIIETDTVSGASPYVFNVSLRSVYGMNGMRADGAKADGFRSMVVAQFTGISLQKDDRAFAKYDKSNRRYNKITVNKVSGTDLSSGSSSTNPGEVYHLDSQSIYRSGWEQTHIRIMNDAILQIVSVFAIGYNKHFAIESGSDASITNSNSNFGQLSLIADGFKKEAFEKDNKAFITNIFTPKSVETELEPIDWLNADASTIKLVVAADANKKDRIYLSGFESIDNIPPILTQGYRIGAKVDDKLFVDFQSITGYGVSEANIYFKDQNNTKHTSFRELDVQSVANNKLDFGQIPYLASGEKVLILSNTGEYPENIIPHQVYFVVAYPTTSATNQNKIALAATKTDAENGNAIEIYGGANLKIISRVTDKIPGEAGHPIQWDGTTQIDRGNGNENVNRWYVTSDLTNEIVNTIQIVAESEFDNGETEPLFIRRNPDPRSLDQKIFKIRVVVPKDLPNGKTPEPGFIIQESSNTGARDNADFSPASFVENNVDQEQKITSEDYDFIRNPRFISTCTYTNIPSTNTGTVQVTTELPHNISVGEQVVIRGVSDNTTNTNALFNRGYNGTFEVTGVSDDNMTFDVLNKNIPAPAAGSSNDTNDRTIDLPRYERNDIKSNLYVYRNEVVSEYIEDQQDGVYHLYALRSDVGITTEFTDLKYSQNVTDLYPQLDRDNVNDVPLPAKSYALNYPIGDVHTSDLKGSVTRDTANILINKLSKDLTVDSCTENVNGISTITFTRNHSFNRLVNGTLGGTLTGHTGSANQVFYNIKLYDANTGTGWRGATATVTVDGTGVITSAVVQSSGSGYKSSDVLWIDSSVTGGGSTRVASFTVGANDFVDSSNDYIQITGDPVIEDRYYRIDSIKNSKEIVIVQPSAENIAVGINTTVISGHIAIHAGRAVPATHSNGVVTSTIPHGLVKGNRFRFVDNDGNNLGDTTVVSRTQNNPTTQFNIDSSSYPSGTPTYILKHIFSANNETSDSSSENIAARSNSFYGGDIIELVDELPILDPAPTLLQGALPETRVRVQNVGTSNNVTNISQRFPIGSYIQVDNEIMRVARDTLINTDKLVVIRGALSTEIATHEAGSLIKKINPIAVEFRRPSIIRASGHTFEYLGYGPGNYSTGLPQVQDRTLTEREEFLSQAQERSAGIVVYTGMNNKGDFYIGNTKKSSATGEETSFDTPIPTVAGENAARLSAIFDEVTVKERIVVEGGDSGLILSQFDGPVTFNKEIRIKDSLNITGRLVVKNQQDSTSTTTGSVRIDGGVGIAKTVNVGGNINLPKDKKLLLGDNQELQLVHDGTNSFVGDTGSGYLGLVSSGTGVFIQKHPVGVAETLAKFLNDGAVELYYDNAKKFETTADGVLITGELQVTDDITAFYSSDERLKNNVTAIDDPLAKVLSLGGYTFDWNENTTKEGTETGVIAQEVEALGLPGLVTTRDNGYLAVNYEKLVPLLIEAVKELSGKVEALEQRLSE